MAEAVRARLAQIHEAGEAWWDSPTADFGVVRWPAGLLRRPPSSAAPERTWFTVSVVNTGVQIRTACNPKQPDLYKGDYREFLPWSDIHRLSVEGADQIERRPSVGAVVAFGVLGLGASREIRRAYLVIESASGDYVFEEQDILPVELASLLRPVVRNIEAAASGTSRDPMAAILDAQLETNRLLSEILATMQERTHLQD